MRSIQIVRARMLKALRNICVAAAFMLSALPAMAAPPNILLVIADDMGLDASPCYDIGGEKPDMPVLEALCRDGLVFDNLWAEPMCSPTRATILTGRFGFRTGVTRPASLRFGGGIRTDELSIQKLLDEKAPTPYAHAVIGKWHLSDSENGGDDNPERMGVGFYSGFISGSLPDYFDFPLTTNGVTTQAKTYATTLFTDIAIDWVAKQRQPWFLWLAHTAPHSPFHVPPAGLHKRDLDDAPAAIKADPLPYFLAALEALDHELGRLLDSLSPEVRANTVVFFIGDNGSPSRTAQRPYTRQTAKGSLYPGGVRVPFVAAGAGVTRKGEREAALVNTSDFFATVADLAEVRATEAEDSISFKPLLASSSGGKRTYTYSDLQADRPARLARNSGWTVGDGRYQYLWLDQGGRYLFDTSADPGGAVNLLQNGAADAESIAARLEKLGTQLRGGR
ncbi:MAG: sulfatase-like hydrolase/transferase [Pseudomonadota bacterium]